MNSMIDDKYNRYYENKEKKTWKFHKKNVCLFVLLTASNRHLRHSAYRKNNNIEKCAGIGLNGFHIK